MLHGSTYGCCEVDLCFMAPCIIVLTHLLCLWQGRGKKDAKQVGAAAVLEMLLSTVPEADFLQPGKSKQIKVRTDWWCACGVRACKKLNGFALC